MNFTGIVPTFYRDLGDKWGHACWGFCIEIHKSQKNNEILHAHELSHIKTFWLSGLSIFIISFVLLWNLFPELIWLSPIALTVDELLFNRFWKYRYWNELRAYKVNVKLGESIEDVATRLSSRFSKISYNKALKDLS